MNSLVILVLLIGVAALFIWKQRSQAGADQARAALRDGALVIDVRGPQEYASGHVPGAINIPFPDLRAQITRHAPDKDQALLLHCLSGVRSGMGKRALEQLGYTRVLNLGSYGRAANIVKSSRE